MLEASSESRATLRFFRDAHVYEFVGDKVLPLVLAARRPEVRVWNVGCGSGEEAYSLAILLCERLFERSQRALVRVFATDVDPEAIARARLGRYPAAEVARQVSPARLASFFVQHGSVLQVSRDVRQTCIFSVHDLSTDPPYRNCDLIACRGVLAPLDPEARRVRLRVLHYALSPGGFLLLGPADGPCDPALFQRVHAGLHVYRRREPGATQTLPEVPWMAASGPRRGKALPAEVVQAADEIFETREKLQTAIEDLEVANEELRVTNEELNEANEMLRESRRRKDEFLAVLSHQLRNPLTPIRSALFVLDHAEPRSDKAAHARAVIDRQLGHLSHLVDDLLDVTRITSGKVRLQREHLDLVGVVARTAEDHRAAFEQAGVALEVQPAPEAVWVNADRTRVSQIVGNLLQNARKFTPRGGRATVSVEADPEQRQAVLRVKDTGRGIAPELAPRLFEPFAQADATLDRSEGGLGIGLAIAKGLVELHGGSIQADDGPREGATFTVRLPLVEHVGHEKPRSGPKPVEPRRVLVIEDSEDSAEMLRDVLEFQGHHVTVAGDGRAGLEEARRAPPEVVICDIGLPGMDGYEVARTMRSDPALQGVALVALSGYARPEDVARSRDAGFDAHVAKPLGVESLPDLMAKIEAGRAHPR